MGILRNADDSPTFTTGDPLGATPLNVMRDTLVAVDEATRLGGYAFTSLYGQHPEENMEPAWVVWRGGFVFLAGMTTLRVVTLSSGTVSGATLRVYRGDTGANDALPATYTDHTLSSGQQTFLITISGAGYAAGQVVRLHLELRRTGSPVSSMNVDILAVEAYPISLSGWPGVPTFGSAAAITAANLNQLAAASDWLVARCALRYDPLFILHLRRIGPFRNAVGESDANVRWYGSVRRTTLHPSVTARGRVMVLWGGATEAIQLVVAGSVVSTYSVPTALGEHAWELTASLAGYSADTLVGLQLRYVRSAPDVTDTPVNRWTVNEVFTPTPTGGGSTLAPWAVRQGGVSSAALVSWLASLAALAQAAYDRIAANDALWEVQRAFTARPASGMDQFRWFEPWGVPATWRRAGEALVGRGRGLTIGYGPGYFDEAALKAQGDGGIGAYPLTNNRTHPFIDGDNVETGRLFLDSVPGLYAGAPYNVRGEEAYYLAEVLKVVD